MADVAVAVKRLNFWNKLIVQDSRCLFWKIWGLVPDLLWLHQTHLKCFGLPCPESDFLCWFASFLIGWKMFYTSGCLFQFGTNFNMPVPGTSLTSESCHICNRMLKGKAALTQHLKKRLSIFPYAAHFATNLRCPVRSKTFSCKLLVLQHLCCALCGVRLRDGDVPLVDDDLFDEKALFRNASKCGMHLFAVPWKAWPRCSTRCLAAD